MLNIKFSSKKEHISKEDIEDEDIPFESQRKLDEFDDELSEESSIEKLLSLIERIDNSNGYKKKL